MKKRQDGLATLLNLNGSLYRGVAFREGYHFSPFYRRREAPQTLKSSGDLLGWGEILVEKLKRIKTLHGTLKSFGVSPYLEKLFRRNTGNTL